MPVDKSLIAENALDKLSKEQLNELIFTDGLSTKEDVDEISGRGVGMAAVKKKIMDLGGQIQVTSQIGEGTGFQISVPRIFQL